MMLNRLRKTLLIAPLLLTTILPASAQRRNDAWNNGVRQGGRGGNYYNDHDRHYQQQNQGGIGPGKGALIGGAGGAALGAIFGKSLKGTLIGGAAGAGVGAIAGGVAQSKRNNNNRYNNRPYRR